MQFFFHCYLQSFFFLDQFQSVFLMDHGKTSQVVFILVYIYTKTYESSYITGLQYWKNNLNDILWIRNQIVAPISEEFTFRSCMVPQLLLCYSKSQAMITSPLFFGVGNIFLHSITLLFIYYILTI